MGPNVGAVNRRGVSPKRSAGQIVANPNNGPSGSKIPQGQRAKSSG
jgi:hypothetical protein